jgi:hypothetical protein
MKTTMIGIEQKDSDSEPGLCEGTTATKLTPYYYAPSIRGSFEHTEILSSCFNPIQIELGSGLLPKGIAAELTRSTS